MTPETQHAHRYRFPSPDGPVATGVCPCGATQTARNFAGDDAVSTFSLGRGLSSHLTAEERLYNDYKRSLRGTSRGEF